MEQSGTAYKNDMCTEHGNEKTCSVKIWEFPDWLRNWILQNPGSESQCDTCGQTDRQTDITKLILAFEVSFRTGI